MSLFLPHTMSSGGTEATSVSLPVSLDSSVLTKQPPESNFAPAQSGSWGANTRAGLRAACGPQRRAVVIGEEELGREMSENPQRGLPGHRQRHSIPHPSSLCLPEPLSQTP